MILKKRQALSAIILIIHLAASPALANDPLSIKLDNMKNGITRLISAVEEQRTQLEQLKSEIQTAGPNDETLEQIASVNGEIEDLQASISAQFREVELNASNMKSLIDVLADENAVLKREQQQLFDRLAEIENIFRMEKQVDAIVKRGDGSAEIFRLNTLTEFKNTLPSSDLCTEYAEVLQNFPARDLNAFFVMGDNSEVQLCKLEYGLTEWRVVAASIADRGHIIQSN
jgi:chromosome segregation ATPase